MTCRCTGREAKITFRFPESLSKEVRGLQSFQKLWEVLVSLIYYHIILGGIFVAVVDEGRCLEVA